MVPIELLAQDVPKSLIARHGTESETDIPEERTLSTSFNSYVTFQNTCLPTIGDKSQG